MGLYSYAGSSILRLTCRSSINWRCDHTLPNRYNGPKEGTINEEKCLTCEIDALVLTSGYDLLLQLEIMLLSLTVWNLKLQEYCKHEIFYN